MDAFPADRAKLRRAIVFSKELWEAAVKMGRSETLLLSQIGGRCPVRRDFAGNSSVTGGGTRTPSRIHPVYTERPLHPRALAQAVGTLGCGGPLFGSSWLGRALKDYSKLNGLQRLWQEIIGAKLNGFRVEMDII
jgi:hypothetical protein